jgi:chemotaxis family two-component system sensor kinase Cph1
MQAESGQRAVDLSNCDLEPIHIPASIQPHGVLMVLRESDLTIVQASENVGEFFGRDFQDVLQHSLLSLLGPAATDKVCDAIKDGHWDSVNPLQLDVGAVRLEGIVHRHDGALILELESASTTTRHDGANQSLRRALISLQSTRTLSALCDAVVREVRNLTGFERVLLYKFHPGGDGSVEAESKEEFLESYLGLHYPASDIPRQARELYRKNWLRIIPDGRYAPVRILPALRADSNTALDLSFSVLRSVSPIHLEYMANQGVRASMSISLVVRDQLWGLISCANHTEPRQIPYELRSTCEALGRLTSFQITAVDQHQAEIARTSRRHARSALADTLHSGEVLRGVLANPNALMELVRAEGAAVLSESEIETCGNAPSHAAIAALRDWLDARNDPEAFATSFLSSVYPAAAEIIDSASGILSFALPGAVRRRIVWFKPEILKSISWGGNPRKPAETDRSMRIHPRRSFELWQEKVRAHSALWTETDLEAAENLRRDAVEIDLERQVMREQRAVRARDDLVAVVSHDLRSPLGVIQMQAAILLRTVGAGHEEFSRRVQTSAEHIQRSVGRMNALIRDLLDLAKLEAGRFTLQCQAHQMSELVEESLIILRPLAEAKRIALNSNLHGDKVNVDRDRIFQVLSNLVGNAIKFTPDLGNVLVRCETVSSDVQITVSDTGPGIPAELRANVFDRYWQARRSDFEGSGLGLFIAKGIVEAHGGRIRIEDHPGPGATFSFTLPKA